MGNIVTYAENTLTRIKDSEFTPVDSLILSWISYFNFPSEIPALYSFEGIRFAELFRAEYFAELFRDNWNSESSRRLFTAMAASPRFRDIRVMGFTERREALTEKQFAAISFQINDDLAYVAFRGTDATLIGWKEDFNMAFQYPVPSQVDAAQYLEHAASNLTGELRVGGHSKGGNLAVYAAAAQSDSIKQRITRVYSHDGPGFIESVLESDEFMSIASKIDKTVPQSSLIGMLLEQQENYRIVKSTGFSIWQHDPLSWVVENGAFLPISELTSNARYLDRTLNQWVSSMSREDRERFVDLLFSLIDTDNITTTSELTSDWQRNLQSAARTASGMDGDAKEFLGKTVASLVGMIIRNFPELWHSKRNVTAHAELPSDSDR